MRRIPELDAIRGVAAVVILLFHLLWKDWFLPGTAVDCFFVLSGFLITSIILRYQTAPAFLLKFYARRGLRIWPIYFLYLFIVVAYRAWSGTPMATAKLLSYLTYMQNFDYHWKSGTPVDDPLMTHTWTLALEEQFYILWPLLVRWAGARRIVPLSLAVIVASVAARCGGFCVKGPLLARCDGFALGGLLAALLFNPDRVRRHLRRYSLGFAAVMLVALSYPVWGRALVHAGVIPRTASVILGLNLFFVTFLYFGIVGIVACHAGHWFLAPLRDRRLVYLGQISYGLYLYHPLAYGVIESFEVAWPSWVLDALKLAAALAIAALSWRYFESPILSLKDRFSYRSDPAAPRTVSPGGLAVAAETTG
jgi:peptidoglycan/LPS O-acetylase OafA/YrhL